MKKRNIAFLTIFLALILISIPIVLYFTLFSKKCTVTYHLYDGKTKTETVAKGSKVDKPKNPTRTDYIFENWYSDDFYLETYDFDTKVTKDITIYADWNFTGTIHLQTVFEEWTDIFEDQNYLVYLTDIEEITSFTEFIEMVDSSNIRAYTFFPFETGSFFEFENNEKAIKFFNEVNILFKNEDMFKFKVFGNIVAQYMESTPKHIIEAYLLGSYKESGDYNYIEHNNKSYVLKHNGNNSNIQIPETINGKTVAGILGFAFAETTATKIVISKNIKYIGTAAISSSDSLETIEFESEKTLLVINNNGFFDNSALNEINFPNSVIEMGSGVMKYSAWTETLEDGPIVIGKCLYSYKGEIPSEFTIEEGIVFICSDALSETENDFLTTVNCPSSLKKIQMSAFMYCNNLETINLNSGLKKIGTDAFKFCNKLKEINIPSTVNFIGNSAFESCTHLENIFVEEGNETYHSTNGVLFCGTALVLYPAGTRTQNETEITTYSISNGITEIAELAFSRCKLSTISIPASVTKIGSNAFSNCSFLSSVTFAENSNCSQIGNSAFSSCNALQNISLPAGITEISAQMFYNVGLTSITIPENVTIVRYDAFNSCSNLVSVTFESDTNLDEIQSYAFANCVNLSSITFPSSVSKTGSNLFLSNPWLTEHDDGEIYVGTVLYAYKGNLSGSYTVSNGVTQIGTNAFQNKTITEITIPSSCAIISDFAFSNCTMLESVTFSNTTNSTLKTIGTSAFMNCNSLNGIVLPDSVEIIFASAFSGCTNMNGILIGSKIKKIEMNAFLGVGKTNGTGIMISITATVPPTITTLLNTSEYAGLTLSIVVLSESLETYQTAWAAYIDYITSV